MKTIIDLLKSFGEEDDILRNSNQNSESHYGNVSNLLTTNSQKPLTSQEYEQKIINL